jgi:hypothetical protein
MFELKVSTAFQLNAVKCGNYVYIVTCCVQFFQKVNWEFNTVSDTVHIFTALQKN